MKKNNLLKVFLIVCACSTLAAACSCGGGGGGQSSSELLSASSSLAESSSTDSTSQTETVYVHPDWQLSGKSTDFYMVKEDGTLSQTLAAADSEVSFGTNVFLTLPIIIDGNANVLDVSYVVKDNTGVEVELVGGSFYAMNGTGYTISYTVKGLDDSVKTFTSKIKVVGAEHMYVGDQYIIELGQLSQIIDVKLIDVKGSTAYDLQNLLTAEEKAKLDPSAQEDGVEIVWNVSSKTTGAVALTGSSLDFTKLPKGNYVVYAQAVVEESKQIMFADNVDFYDTNDGFEWNAWDGETAIQALITGNESISVTKADTATEECLTERTGEYYKVRSTGGSKAYTLDFYPTHSKEYYGMFEGAGLSVAFDMYMTATYENDTKAPIKGVFGTCKGALNGTTKETRIQYPFGTWNRIVVPLDKALLGSMCTIESLFYAYDGAQYQNVHASESTAYFGNFRVEQNEDAITASGVEIDLNGNTGEYDVLSFLPADKQTVLNNPLVDITLTAKQGDEITLDSWKTTLTKVPYGAYTLNVSLFDVPLYVGAITVTDSTKTVEKIADEVKSVQVSGATYALKDLIPASAKTAYDEYAQRFGGVEWWIEISGEYVKAPNGNLVVSEIPLAIRKVKATVEGEVGAMTVYENTVDFYNESLTPLYNDVTDVNTVMAWWGEKASNLDETASAEDTVSVVSLDEIGHKGKYYKLALNGGAYAEENFWLFKPVHFKDVYNAYADYTLTFEWFISENYKSVGTAFIESKTEKYSPIQGWHKECVPMSEILSRWDALCGEEESKGFGNSFLDFYFNGDNTTYFYVGAFTIEKLQTLPTEADENAPVWNIVSESVRKDYTEYYCNSVTGWMNTPERITTVDLSEKNAVGDKTSGKYYMLTPVNNAPQTHMFALKPYYDKSVYEGYLAKNPDAVLRYEYYMTILGDNQVSYRRAWGVGLNGPIQVQEDTWYTAEVRLDALLQEWDTITNPASDATWKAALLAIAGTQQEGEVKEDSFHIRLFVGNFAIVAEA